jgi:poly(A) polymerase
MADTARAAAVAVVKRLRDAGFLAYFAGGCVRDELLGRAPSDYDVATSALPEQITRLFDRTAEVGAHFGVVLVKVQRDVIEVATFRSDGSYTDARRPDSVQFSTPQEDAKRRDFTVNALFLDPFAHPDKRIIDFVDGVADLQSRVLRAVGDPHQRLAEDHLRALRAVRLASKLDFTIDPATCAAITKHASDLRGISRERIGDELRAMMADPSRARAAKWLAQLQLEAPVFRDMLASLSGDLLERLPDDAGFGLCLAAWQLSRGLPLDMEVIGHTSRNLRDALMLSNREQHEFTAALEGMLIFRTTWSSAPVALRKRILAGPFASGLTLVAATDALEAAGIEAEAQALAEDGIGIEPAMILTGDVLVAWGYKPGPKFKEVLSRVYDAQLEGRVRNIEEARELALRLGV